ncbi:SusC/RagA family TonB-linked outer membrane protein [Flavobacterium adhaerens]|uniref:SusC/RagA family TonB-linked outer membrane protein n=1 Tax=Flavobacterium adhaerens TaxID=3149043 RepID=UPI0032B3F2B7
MTTNHRLFFYCNLALPKKGWLLALVLMLFSAINVSAQQADVVTGKITSDSDGLPLPGVNILVKGSKTTASTGFDGEYSINAKPTDVLVFSYIGYETKEITIANRKEINYALKDNNTKLNEVVVIGYGTQKKADLTGSVSIVNVADAKKTITYDVAKMLQGQAAGVTVQSSGEPGGFVNIKIRGISSFNNTNPLFVVDGMMVDSPYDFSTGEVESMQVLKDASSAAIYGVRGANGVIIITTKKGKAGQVGISYKNLFGVQNVARKWDVTNREQYQKVVTAAEQNYMDTTGIIIGIAPANDPTNPAYINDVDTDWQDAAFKTGTIQNHSLTINGGAEALSYNVNLDYFKNTGYVESPQDYERYTTTLNFNGKKGKFKYGGKLAYTKSDKENFTEYLNSVVGSLATAIPTMPVYDSNRLGGYGGTVNSTQRAISLNVIGYNNVMDNTTERNRFIGDIWGEYEIITGLKFKTDVSFDRTDWHNHLYNPPSDLGWYYIVAPEKAQLDVELGNTTRTFFNNFLTYEKTINKHKFDALVGWIQEENNFYKNWSRGIGYETGEISQIQNATSIVGGEWESKVTNISYLSRFNYNFDDKYLVQANFRQDKSSLFAPENNTGNFYSFSGAWKLSNEKFIADILPSWINTIKLRGGYGELGNNAVAAYAYSPTVNAFVPYTWGGASTGTSASGTIVTDIKDINIHWETTASTNIAAELGLLDNKLQFSGEYFVRKSTDLLFSVPLPATSGSTGSIMTNAGDVENKGFEFTLGYTNNDHAFKYGISANFGTLENKVTKIGNDNSPITLGPSRTEIGRSIGELYAWETEGIFQTQAEIDAAPTQSISTRPGDIKFKDVNDDGVIDDKDRTFQGVSIPKYSYGINLNFEYKSFELSMLWQGAGGNKVFNAVYRDLMAGQYGNSSTDILNYWTPTNTNTDIPRPVINDPNANTRDSNRFIEDGDYIKLQNFQIGYNIPLGNKAIFQKAKIFANGQNIWTITNYKGYDPDFINDGLLTRGYDRGSFPNPRTFSMGVQVDF